MQQLLLLCVPNFWYELIFIFIFISNQPFLWCKSWDTIMVSIIFVPSTWLAICLILSIFLWCKFQQRILIFSWTYILHPDLGALDLRYLWSCQLYFIVLSHACQDMINAKLLNSMAGSHVGIFISAFCGIEHVYRDLHSTTKHLCHNIPIHLLLCWNSSR